MNNISTHLEDHILHVKFNRPEKKNAFTAQMYQLLTDTLTAAENNDDVRVFLLSGAGSDFTAGNDVGMFVQTDASPTVSPASAFMRAFIGLTKPIVASVRGYAVGIGATMLIHCDHVVVSSDARIRFPFVDLGLSPEFGSTVTLAAFVGKRRANEWLLLCPTIDANAALQAGFVNAVVEPTSLAQEAGKVARRYAEKPTLALAMTRQLLRTQHSEQTLARMHIESPTLDRLRQSDEAQGIFQQFLQRSATSRA